MKAQERLPTVSVAQGPPSRGALRPPTGQPRSPGSPPGPTLEKGSPVDRLPSPSRRPLQAEPEGRRRQPQTSPTTAQATSLLWAQPLRGLGRGRVCWAEVTAGPGAGQGQANSGHPEPGGQQAAPGRQEGAHLRVGLGGSTGLDPPCVPHTPCPPIGAVTSRRPWTVPLQPRPAAPLLPASRPRCSLPPRAPRKPSIPMCTSGGLNRCSSAIK